MFVCLAGQEGWVGGPAAVKVASLCAFHPHSSPIFRLACWLTLIPRIVTVNLRPVSKLPQKSFFLKNLPDEFVRVEGQSLRSLPQLGMTT